MSAYSSAVSSERLAPVPGGVGSDAGSVTDLAQRVSLVVDREAPVATHVEMLVAPSDPTIDNYVVRRNTAPGRYMNETLSPEAKGASYQAFQGLVQYLGQQLRNHDGSTLTRDQVALLRVRVNPQTQMARWTFAGTGVVHHVDLSQDDVAFGYISAMVTPIAKETRQGDAPLTRYVGGVNGVANGDHALARLNVPRRDPSSFFDRHNPSTDPMPRDFSTYAGKQLERAMGDAAASDRAVIAMKEMATANLYRDRTIRFLEGQIATKTGHIRQARMTQVSPAVIEHEERTLRQMEEQLHRIRSADMYALYTAIAHQDKVDAASTDMDKALALEAAVAKDLRDLVGLHAERPWYNPAGLRRNNEGVTADAREYARWVGSLAITDRRTYYDYCELQGLEPSNQMTVEQHFFRPEPGSDKRDVARGVLFRGILDDQFQQDLGTMLMETKAAVLELHADMENVLINLGGISTGAAIKACVKLYEAAAK